MLRCFLYLLFLTGIVPRAAASKLDTTALYRSSSWRRWCSHRHRTLVHCRATEYLLIAFKLSCVLSRYAFRCVLSALSQFKGMWSCPISVNWLDKTSIFISKLIGICSSTVCPYCMITFVTTVAREAEQTMVQPARCVWRGYIIRIAVLWKYIAINKRIELFIKAPSWIGIKVSTYANVRRLTVLNERL